VEGKKGEVKGGGKRREGRYRNRLSPRTFFLSRRLWMHAHTCDWHDDLTRLHTRFSTSSSSSCPAGVGVIAVRNREEPLHDVEQTVMVDDELEWSEVIVDVHVVTQHVPLVQYRRVLGSLLCLALRVVEPQQTAVVVLETTVTVAEQLATYTSHTRTHTHYRTVSLIPDTVVDLCSVLSTVHMRPLISTLTFLSN